MSDSHPVVCGGVGPETRCAGSPSLSHCSPSGHGSPRDCPGPAIRLLRTHTHTNRNGDPFKYIHKKVCQCTHAWMQSHTHTHTITTKRDTDTCLHTHPEKAQTQADRNRHDLFGEKKNGKNTIKTTRT